LFAREFNAEPDEEKWRGHGGIISQIQQKLSLNRGTRIDHVMREYLVCLEDGTKYDGESAHLLDQSWQ
jgi:predicted transcriptional regulator